MEQGLKPLTITLTPDLGAAWNETVKVDIDTMKQAATNSARAVARLFKVRADLNIEAAGGKFATSKRFRSATKVIAYPNSQGAKALDPAVELNNKIPFAGVFENGEVIHGNPIMWLPLTSTPLRVGSRRVTPSTFETLTGGKLIPFRDPQTGNLLLGVRVKVPKSVAAGDKSLNKLSLNKIKRFVAGEAKTGVEVTFPVFVAIRLTTIRKRLDMRGVAESASAEWPGLYARNMEDLVG